MDLKINKSNLSYSAYTKIKMLVFSGGLKSGEKIIQEKMAEKLGISRIPLIQALSILQKERLLSYSPGKGFTVRKISAAEFNELLDLRCVLEGLAIKKITQNLTASLKEELLAFLRDFEKYYKNNNINKYSELDKKFHSFIFKESKNTYLNSINESYNILILIYTKGFKSDLNISIQDHRKIINAILEGKSKKARRLAEEHLEKVRVFF